LSHHLKAEGQPSDRHEWNVHGWGAQE
jgi:hypothetical protein